MIETLQHQWSLLSSHAKTMVGLCLALLAFILFWSAAAKPALRSIESSQARIAKASTQLIQIQSMEAQAIGLRGAATASRDTAARGVEAAAAALPGKATVLLHGSFMSVKMEAIPAQELHQFIVACRQAGSMPDQAVLTRDTASGLWSATFELRLPKEAP
jgi:type II secretory pathway component PulM